MPTISNATIEKTRQEGGTFRCDKCKKTFEAEQIAFAEMPENFHILTPGMEPLQTEDGKLLACPYCGQSHLYGFDKVLPRVLQKPVGYDERKAARKAS